MEAVEASEVAEAAEFNEAGEVSKAQKITTVDFRVFDSIILGLISRDFDVMKNNFF